MSFKIIKNICNFVIVESKLKSYRKKKSIQTLKKGLINMVNSRSSDQAHGRSHEVWCLICHAILYCLGTDHT